MSIAGNARDMLKATAYNTLDKTENSQVLLEQAMRDKRNVLNEAKIASALAIDNAKKLEIQIAEVKSELNTWEERIKAAIEKGREDLEHEAMTGKKEASVKLTELRNSCQAAKKQSENLLSSIKGLEEEVEKMESQMMVK